MTAAQVRSATVGAKATVPVVVEVLIAGRPVRLGLIGWDLHRNGVEVLILRAADVPPAEPSPSPPEEAAS